MSKAALRSILVILICLGLAAGVAMAAADGGLRLGAVPIVLYAAAIAFLVQWLAFIPAYSKQTEVFYDLTGSITYISVVLFALIASASFDPRSLLLAGLICIWALRLGSFLFVRILKDGGDGRFDDIKPRFWRFLATWTLQGLWVFLTLCAALAAITGRFLEPIGGVELIGAAIWIAGFAIESIADRQKREFRKQSGGDRNQFIQSGLWAWSRHPNYFGEILLWIGIAVIAAPAFNGWQWLTLISPVFVALLLCKVSGIPLLEARADKKWGGQPEYERYKARTHVLLLLPPRD